MDSSLQKNSFHITAHYYGQWLQSDLRGWRERDHRRHVEGDYHNPPAPNPEQAKLLAHAKRSLKQAPVVLSSPQLQSVGALCLHETKFHNLDCIALAVSVTHVHALMAFPDANAKHYIGMIKRGILFGMKRDAKWTGQLWATGLYAKSIHDRAPHVRTFNYILRHRDEGASVWSFRDRNPP